MNNGVPFGQHIPCRFCIIKATQQIGDGGNGGVLNLYEDHVIVTIPFNHVTEDGSIFFTCPLDKNSDCTSIILSEHATFKKTTHSLRPRQVILIPLQYSIDGMKKKNIIFIHLETQYAKINCKNIIYAKNWIRRTWTAKVNTEEKSTIKVNVVNGQWG